MARFFYLLSVFSLLFTSAIGQTNNDVEMADALIENGKIYIVVISVLIILIGLFIYLIRLEKKIGQLEKKLNEHEQTKFHA